MKNIATLPADVDFMKALAESLWRDAGQDPLQLSEQQVFLPTRRACRALGMAFEQVTCDKASLLPRLQPLGDVDEVDLFFSESEAFSGDFDLSPSIAPLRRQLLLVQLIRRKDPSLPFGSTAALASALARFIDEVHTERADFSNLKNLVPDDLAQHWQETLRFLEIITAEWPNLLRAEGNVQDPAKRRNEVLKAVTESWRQTPPKEKITVAGATGSMPAIADFIDQVASLHNGMVILPGLDLALDEEAWQDVAETHPQYAMKKLLDRMGVARKDVPLWGGVSSPRVNRVRFLQESMRPASTTQAWRKLTTKEIPAEAWAGLERLDLEHQQEEAEVIALRLRALLEEPQKKALFVTTDRALATRVGMALRRWDIEVNDSAGQALSTTSVGAFLEMVCVAASPDASCVDYLSLLKHPLTAGGIQESLCRTRARRLEIEIWRGIRRQGGWRAASKLMQTNHPEIASWCEKLADVFDNLAKDWHTPLPLHQRLKAHIDCAEFMASTETEAGGSRLWLDVAGEKAGQWFSEAIEAAKDFPPLTGADYLSLFQGLMNNVTVHLYPHEAHPRLNILGPLEARLQQADLVILGGLNEGGWPPEAAVDPWLSRPMQKDFGLPLPEWRIGVSAHDFVQLASAPQVLLTRSKRSGGSPTVPSRFLLQMQAVLQAVLPDQDRASLLKPTHPWAAWARDLDRPEPSKEVSAAALPPIPRPPVSARPRKLSVTEIGTWQVNPYAIYAKRILKLKKLEDLDQDLGAADYGQLIHKALELFLQEHPKKWPARPLDSLLAIGRKVFTEQDHEPVVMALWWPRFVQIAKWFVDNEQKQRAEGTYPVALEASAEMDVFSGAFTLTGRVDRIDQTADGSLTIIDYKSALLPTAKSVTQGYEPQLPLLAAMAMAGGFKTLEASAVDGLYYWSLKGGATPGKKISITNKENKTVETAVARLEDLVASYSKASMPYLAVPNPNRAPRYNDYKHLSREAEWSLAGGDE